MSTVRPLAPGDSFAELTDLLHAAYAPLAAQGLRYLASHQDAATTEKRAKGGQCFVAVADNQTLAGTITLYGPTPDSPCQVYREPDVWHFAQFAVLPAQQSHGVGSRLLETVETFAETQARFASPATPPNTLTLSSPSTPAKATNRRAASCGKTSPIMKASCWLNRLQAVIKEGRKRHALRAKFR